jgi:hypothetical protein
MAEPITPEEKTPLPDPVFNFDEINKAKESALKFAPSPQPQFTGEAPLEQEGTSSYGSIPPAFQFDFSKVSDSTKKKVEDIQASGGSLLHSIFDFLSRGEYASANIADYLIDRYKEDEAGQPFSHDDFVNMASLAWKGFSGEEKMTYDTIIDKEFPSWGKGKRMAVSLSAALFLDPTTYMPLGAPAKFAAKTLKQSKTAQKLGQRAERSFVGKALIPEAGTPAEYKAFKAEMRATAMAERNEILHEIAELSKGTTAQDRELMSFVRQNPDKSHLLTPKLHEKLEAVGQKFDDLIEKAHSQGLINEAQYISWKGREGKYLPGIYDRTKILSGKLPPQWTTQKPNFMKEKVFDTLDDAQAVADSFTEISKAKNFDEFKDLCIKNNIDFNKTFAAVDDLPIEVYQKQAAALARNYTPEKDIMKLYGIRALEQESIWKVRRQFVDGAVEKFGKQVPANTKVVPEGYGLYYPLGKLRTFLRDVIDPKDADDLLQRIIGTGGDPDMINASALEDIIQQIPSVTTKVPLYRMPKAIADDLNRAGRSFAGDEATNALIHNFDRLQNLWKGLATSVRLPFHIRNAYSNMFQAWLSGLGNPKRYSDAASLQLSIATKSEKVWNLGGKEYTTEALRKLINTTGVRGRGWQGSDVQIGMLKELDSVLKHGWRRYINPIRSGRALGTVVEDNARIAVFMDQLSKGANPSEAARVVRKYLFDYTELTEFEQKVMKRAIPFYTWVRKNVPLQVEGLLTQPRKYQFVGKAQRAIAEPETNTERLVRPEYFDKLMYVKTHWKTDEGKAIYGALDIPPLEFNRITDPHQIGASVSPIKSLLEVAFNKKIFPEISDISRYPGDKVRAPFWINFMPEKVKEGFEKVGIVSPIIEKRTGKTILGVNAKFLHLAHSLLPVLSEQSRVHAEPITLTDERPKMWLRSYLSGVGLKAMDTQEEQLRQAYDIVEAGENISMFVSEHARWPNNSEIKSLVKNKRIREMIMQAQPQEAQ